MKPGIEFWAFTGRAVGTFPDGINYGEPLISTEIALKARLVIAPNAIWGNRVKSSPEPQKGDLYRILQQDISFALPLNNPVLPRLLQGFELDLNWNL